MAARAAGSDQPGMVLSFYYENYRWNLHRSILRMLSNLESDLSRVGQEHTRLLKARSIICIGQHTQLLCSDPDFAAYSHAAALSGRYSNWLNPDDWKPVAAVHLSHTGVVVLATSASSTPPGSLVQFNARTAQRAPTALVERWSNTKVSLLRLLLDLF